MLAESRNFLDLYLKENPENLPREPKSFFVDGGADSNVYGVGDKAFKIYRNTVNSGQTPLTVNDIKNYQKLTNEISVYLESLNYCLENNQLKIPVKVNPIEEVFFSPEICFPVAVSKFIEGNTLTKASSLIPDLANLNGEISYLFINLGSKFKVRGIVPYGNNIKVIKDKKGIIQFTVTDLCPSIRIAV